ncbi:lysylphosphatidylglycerol synthase domain-containing protein [Azotobacter salinestris]|uniref:lysylphosphatidylglycerol synthase domain-containing protein n=1 Tax=Azotobacter salinestris TaxID=69964 RepID=UPI001266A2A1|nr:lysylphosphatidylglycerol synthase domain-containing protein [Azotobacter salinestris]
MKAAASLAARLRSHWPLVRRVLVWIFFLLMTGLLFSLARNIEWRNVLATLAGYRPGILLLALAIAAASHLLYSCFDLLGRRYAHHQLPQGQVLAVTFVCYAFNLNLGAWIGGLAMRYRLYSRLGLSTLQITRIYSLSLTTNWIAYLLLAGLTFAAGTVRPPAHWAIGHGSLQALGVLLLVLVALYLLLCAFSRRRVLSVRGHSLGLPSLRLALWQLVLGAGNWLLMALVIHTLLLQQVGYGSVLGTLLIASIAGVLTHIPAGLGVLETVFVALLHQQVERDSVLAALLGYRAIYYLLPLSVASLVYLGLEARAKRMRRKEAGKLA